MHPTFHWSVYTVVPRSTLLKMISFNVSPLRNPSLQISRKHSDVWRHFPPFIEMFTKDFMIFTGPRCLWGLVYGSRSLYLCHSNTVCWDFAVVTLADDDTNSILTDDANRAIWSWWSSLRWRRSGKLVWRCSMWAMTSPRRSARWCKSCREYWSCDHVGDNVCCWPIV